MEERPFGRPSHCSTGLLADDNCAVTNEIVAASVPGCAACRNSFAGGLPLFPGLHVQAEPIVIHPEIAVAAAHDSLRQDRFDFLRHHTDIGLVTSIVAEAIEAEAVVEMAQQNDVV